MATPYSHKHFFRKIPLSQLASFFESKGVYLGIDFSTFNNKQVDKLFAAFTGLPDELQTAIEAEFQDIHAMACDGGIQALIDEAAFPDHKEDGFVEAISAIDGLHAKVMWAFLEKRHLWQGATLLPHADNVSSASWRKRNDLPRVPPDVELAAIKALANAISAYFHDKEGRGRNCKVEPYRPRQQGIFLCLPRRFWLSWC